MTTCPLTSYPILLSRKHAWERRLRIERGSFTSHSCTQKLPRPAELKVPRSSAVVPDFDADGVSVDGELIVTGKARCHPAFSRALPPQHVRRRAQAPGAMVLDPSDAALGASGVAALTASGDMVTTLALYESNGLRGFKGGFLNPNGRFGYLVPHQTGSEKHGDLVRVDLDNFSPSGIRVLHLTDVQADLKGFNGGCWGKGSIQDENFGGLTADRTQPSQPPPRART